MLSTLALCASLLAVAPSPQHGEAGLPAPDASGDVRRTPALPAAPLRPELAAAARAVHAFERRCFALGLYTPAGTVHPRPFPRDAPEDHPVRAFLLEGGPVEGGAAFPGWAGFAFDGESPTLEHLLECGRYDAGYAAASALLEAAPDLDPRELLRALADEVITAADPAADELGARLHVIASRQRRLAPLGNGSLAYVAWGLLMQPAPWERREGDERLGREAFVSSVLARGATSEVSSWVAERVLQPPLAWTEERAGRGIAMARGRSRGRIGFTEADQALLEGLARDPRVDGSSPAISEARLQEWVATMLDRVLRDRGTSMDADARMRRGSLAERRRYWSDLAVTSSFPDLHAAAVEELHALSTGSAMLPGAERLLALRDAAAVGPLTEEEAEELASLERDVRAARTALARHLLAVVTDAAGPDRVARMTASLAGELHEALGGVGTPRLRERLLGEAWRRLSWTNSEQGLWVVRDHLDGLAVLEGSAASAMISGLVIHRRDGADALLAEVCRRGGVLERGAAVANPQWMTGEAFGRDVGGLMERTADRALAPFERQRLRLDVLSALGRWEGPEADRLLRQSFEQGLWSEEAGPDSWSRTARGPWLDRVLARVGEAERAELVERGLVPAALFEG